MRDYVRTCVNVLVYGRGDLGCDDHAEAVCSKRELTQPTRSIVFDNLIFFARKRASHAHMRHAKGIASQIVQCIMNGLGCGQLYPQQARHPAPLTKDFMIPTSLEAIAYTKESFFDSCAGETSLDDKLNASAPSVGCSGES